MNGLKIRWKLTLWYGGVLGVILLIFSSSVLAIMSQHLMRRIDLGLSEELADVRSEIVRASSDANLKDWLDRRFAEHAGFDFQITRPNGERFFVNSRLTDKSWPNFQVPNDESNSTFQTLTRDPGDQWRIIQVSMNGPEGNLKVQVGRSLAAYRQEFNELFFTFLLVGPLTLIAVICGGYFLAYRVLLPVQEMTRAANEISAERLYDRIDISNPCDELGELGATLNHMIERLERSFAETKRFTADAAHELRTPLAIIRNEAEVTLRLQRSESEYKCVLENILEETNRLTEVADQLLFLSQQEAAQPKSSRERVNLQSLLADVVNDMHVVAKEKTVSLNLTENEECEVAGERHQLRRLFYNLIDNAIKYSNAGGKVEVGGCIDGDEAVVTVSDNGCGIPLEHQSKIFGRFYRVDASRTEGGVGLGLAICQSIVRNCAGTIKVESNVGKGTVFTVRLPQQVENHSNNQLGRS